MQEEYLHRVCKYVSEEKEFARILPQRLREDAERVLDERMRHLFKNEKCAAEIVKLFVKRPDILTRPLRRDVRIILDDTKKSQEEKVAEMIHYANN